MFRIIAYIIFICAWISSFFLIFTFLGSENMTSRKSQNSFISNNVSKNSSKLQSLESYYAFKKSTQNDVFGAFIFNFWVKILVSDRVRMYVFDNDYTLIRRNLLLLWDIYDFTDSDDLFWKTFFLNEKNGDSPLIRFLTEIDGRAVWFEVFRDEYTNLKSLLLK